MSWKQNTVCQSFALRFSIKSNVKYEQQCKSISQNLINCQFLCLFTLLFDLQWYLENLVAYDYFLSVISSVFLLDL